MVCMILVPFWSPSVDHQSSGSGRIWQQTDLHPEVILARHCGVGTRGHQSAAGAAMGAIRHPRTESPDTKSHSSRHTSHMNLTSCSRNVVENRPCPKWAEPHRSQRQAVSQRVRGPARHRQCQPQAVGLQEPHRSGSRLRPRCRAGQQPGPRPPRWPRGSDC